MTQIDVHVGDCLTVLDRAVAPGSVDLAYLDPPFFTQNRQLLKTRHGDETFEFEDRWDNIASYSNFITDRLVKVRSKLKPTGSVFFHCDRSASHIVRLLLDRTFGTVNFQSEIIWHFRRWSNARQGLLNSHQTIYFYSRGRGFKFNASYEEYSPTTNVDQIMQKRVRDERGKSVYARTAEGTTVTNGAKKGVPLSDVWEIPFLNPKARERVGYPTQKPVILLKRIVELTTQPGDMILDPFCGSGTSLVAAKILDRNAVGIDVSADAVRLTQERLSNPIVTGSSVLAKGRSAYDTHDREAALHLAAIDYVPVQRNRGIDGVLRHEVDGRPVLVRVQRNSETLEEAATAIVRASAGKGECLMVVVVTKDDHDLIPMAAIENLRFVKSTQLSLSELVPKEPGSSDKPYGSPPKP